MRHGKKMLAGLLVLLLPVLVWAGLARAQDFRTGDNVTVAQGQTIDSTLWSAGRNIDISGTVNGDIFCAGQNVNISATVNGDVICAGQDIRISGPVNGDVRVAGQNVTVSSKISGNLSAAAATFSLDQSASVGRDASIASADTTINGSVVRDLSGAGTSITLANQVGRNVKATVDKLTLTSSAKVGGNLTYTSKNNANIASGAVIAGTTHRSEPRQEQRRVGLRHVGLIFGLYILVSLLIIALVLVLLVPRMFVVISDAAVLRPWWTLLTGFLATLIFPMLFLVLLFTVIGIPLALLLLCTWMLVFEVGSLAFSFWIGRLIFRNRGNAILMMLVGALIVLVALMIPLFGFFVFLAMTWWGIGMVLTALWQHFQRPSYALAAVVVPTPVTETAASATTSSRSNSRRKS